MKTMNYDSSFYSTLQNRNLPAGHEVKKTLSSIVANKPLNNRQTGMSHNNRFDSEKRAPTNISYVSSSKLDSSPRPPSDLNNSFNTNSNNHMNRMHFDTFSTANNYYNNKIFSSSNPINKPMPPSSFNTNNNNNDSSGSDNENLHSNKVLNHLTPPHIQLKPLSRSDTITQRAPATVIETKQNANNDETNQINRRLPAKINKAYLQKMKRKHKFKITANMSGTKFDLGTY
jgi:hypothetical protein